MTEGGQTGFFASEDRVDLLNVAGVIRRYINSEARGSFSSMLPRLRECDPSEFQSAVMERVENTDRVVGTFTVDMDAGILSSLDGNGGWHQYRFRDLSVAAYAAHRKTQERYERRLEIFAEKLRGRELTLMTEVRSPAPMMGQTM